MNFKEDLKTVLDFWQEKAIDHKNGGIYTCLDRFGNIYGTDKSVWFQGRALWSFSKAYNTIEKNDKYLESATTIYNFIEKCVDKKDGRMFFTVTEDGRELQKRRYYFSETFAAIGCFEYYKATGLEKALKDAEKYFDIAYECYRGVRHCPPKVNPENCKTKALSPIMIMLATTQILRSIETPNKKKYDEIARECLEEILHGGFLKKKALLECVGENGEYLNTPSGRIVNPGHSLEAAWFILSEGIMTDNKEAIDVAKKIIDITLPIGLDKKHGGIIAFADIEGKPPVQLEWDMKLWWPQCEAMIALRLAYNIFKEEKYQREFEKLLDYCEKYFVDREYGEWYGYLHYDNTPSTDLKGNIFKGPFHVPRFYIIMAILEEYNDISKFLS